MTGRSTARPHYVAEILARLARAPERPGIRWRGRVLTAGDLLGSVLHACERLRTARVGEGSTVGILTEVNHPLTLTVRYAAHLLGATVVHIRSTNPGSDRPLSLADQAAILAECGARHLVVDPPHAERADRLREYLATGPTATGLSTTVLDLADRVGEMGSPPGPPGPALSPECAVVTYTSGSTGRPKGIRQSFAAWNHLVLADAAFLAGRGETMLIVTPTSHTVAVMADVVLASGGTLVLHEHFDAAQVLSAIETERITRTYLTVPQLYRLLDQPELADTGLSSLRQLVYSGCPASPARLDAAFRAFGPSLVQCYGSTEAGRITLLDQLDHYEPELRPSVGRPFPGVAVRICDPASGRELPEGRTGEVQVRSPHLMTGYQGDPERTAAVLHDGWLRTGDLGHWDRYGYLHLVDRIDRVIKCDGERIHPAEVEKALLAHPAVADCAVYGARDDDAIEQVHAAVVLVRAVEPAELRRHVATLLSPRHAPSRITRWAELPLTDTGKPDQRCLQTGSATGAIQVLEESELTS
ncbi:fatty acid--CoA ligase family protein [Kitasatospora sp. GP82]|uniref:class I adenylate-forming enzyme family protein n=1 Tax=Kitasatospora sp. GP82 TaxID=3035089 RepID=UPI002473E411|nr:fatty acid--CoA ligase family protein [Kitasatospora sp. GP82]MDH6130008.1 fatty-acyl-CoA synthase [Kitasatospora sp. GP82]